MQKSEPEGVDKVKIKMPSMSAYRPLPFRCVMIDSNLDGGERVKFIKSGGHIVRRKGNSSIALQCELTASSDPLSTSSCRDNESGVWHFPVSVCRVCMWNARGVTPTGSLQRGYLR